MTHARTILVTVHSYRNFFPKRMGEGFCRGHPCDPARGLPPLDPAFQDTSEQLLVAIAMAW